MSELISVGGYGCVYKPSIDCHGNTTLNMKKISKLQVDNDSSRNEIAISSKLKKYPNFFVVPTKHCKIKKNKVKKQDCPLTQKAEDLFIIEMNYIPNKSFFDILVDDNSLERQIYILLFNYSALLKSLDILRKHHIIHFDLKLDNILYDIVDEYPKILDFGISLDTKKISLTHLKKTFWIYAPWYYVWCPDIHFMCYLMNVDSNIDLSTVEKIVRDCIEKNEILALMDKKYLVQYEIAYVKHLSKYIGMSVKDIAKDILKYSANWDVYSLGLIFIKLSKFITTKNKIKHPFFDFFIDILKINIQPDHSKQLCEKDILTLLYDYIHSGKIKTPIINKGFTPKYVDTIKRFHKEHWSLLELQLLSAKK